MVPRHCHRVAHPVFFKVGFWVAYTARQVMILRNKRCTLHRGIHLPNIVVQNKRCIYAEAPLFGENLNLTTKLAILPTIYAQQQQSDTWWRLLRIPTYV